MDIKTQIIPKLSKVALKGRGFKPMFLVKYPICRARQSTLDLTRPTAMTGFFYSKGVLNPLNSFK